MQQYLKVMATIQLYDKVKETNRWLESANARLELHQKMQQEFVNVRHTTYVFDSTYSWHDRCYSLKKRTDE